MQNVRKAVIAAAGLGTRFLPQTKAMPKEMLPIVDRPLIQWVVEDLVNAGVTEIIIVTGPTKRAIEDHFDRSVELEEALTKKGKNEKADQVRDIANMANFVYIRQKGEHVGNALPVINAKEVIGNEPFFYTSADDFVYGGRSRAAIMLEAYNRTGKSVVSMFHVDTKEAPNYGMAQLGPQIDAGLHELHGYVEKPTAEDAPSNYMLMMAYLLTPDFFEYLHHIKPARGGEIWAADAVNMMCQDHKVVGSIVDGEYLDCGNHVNYLRAQLYVASKLGLLNDSVLHGIDLSPH